MRAEAGFCRSSFLDLSLQTIVAVLPTDSESLAPKTLTGNGIYGARPECLLKGANLRGFGSWTQRSANKMASKIYRELAQQKRVVFRGEFHLLMPTQGL
jgi:hypothetical protein